MQRVQMAEPLAARLGRADVVIVDVSVLGAQIRHEHALAAGHHAHLSFEWGDATIAVDCRIVRSTVERVANGKRMYGSGLEFVNMSPEARALLKERIEDLISRAVDERKRQARGAIPQHLPSARLSTDSGFVCLSFENNAWRRKRTHDPGQPSDGFTVSADEDQQQLDLLCDAYQRSDADGRKLIQLFAQLSILEGEGAPS